jgi:hypothetical protein
MDLRLSLLRRGDILQCNAHMVQTFPIRVQLGEGTNVDPVEITAGCGSDAHHYTAGLSPAPQSHHGRALMLSERRPIFVDDLPEEILTHASLHLAEP